MLAKLYTQSYRLDPSDKDPVFHWTPEELGYGERDYEFDENWTCYENAERLSDMLKKGLMNQYAEMGVDPHPVAALIYAETSWFGVEIFYRNQDCTMKLSGRVFLHR